MRWLEIAIACLATSAGHAAQPHVQAEAAVRRAMQVCHIPAVSVAVAHKGEIIWSGAWGLLDLTRKQPATPSSLFELASLGKPITGVGVMLLAQRGTISLDDPLTRYFAELPPTWRPITVRQLLSHTSGLPPSMPATDAAGAQAQGVGWKQLTSQPLVFPPGSATAYSDVGFALLGQVLTLGSRMSPENFLRQEVLSPCAMSDTFFAGEIPASRARATSYTLGGPPGSSTRLARHATLRAGFGIATTANNLARFGVCVQSDRLLGPEARTAMQTPTRLSDGREAMVHGEPYGLAWSISEWRGQAVVEHGGRLGTWLSIFPERDLVVAVLTNLELGSGSDPAMLARVVAGYFDPAFRPPQLETAPVVVEPALIDALRDTLQRLAEGASSEILLPSIAESLRMQTAEARRLWSKRLRAIRSVRPLAIDRPTPARRLRLGEPVARIVHLGVDSKAGRWRFSFWLRADDKVIDFDAELLDD